MTAENLDVYEIACLAGGRLRMIDTALVALVESGRVRVSAPGCLATASLVRRHAVEAAVLDAIGPTGNRSVETVRWRLADRRADPRRRAPAARRRAAGSRRHGGADRPPQPLAAGPDLRRPARCCTSCGTTPPTDAVAGGTSAMAVALHGRERMPDRELCAAVFEPPPTSVLSGGTIRPPADLEFADGWQAAHRTRDQIKADVARHAGWSGGWVPP